ncbi:MAG: hypothetical protein KJ556_21385 [Gammaproteobacteria bacterium]|nr:hypothetical protein [Gammaproteobacteria bacterium]
MTTPTLPLRRLLAAGAKKSAQVWGTAEALGAAFGMLIEGDGGLSRKQPYLPAKEADTPFVLEGDLGNIDPVDFAPAFTMRYDPGALGILIAQLFATAGAPSEVATGYAHILKWAEENYGEFATFAVERASKIFEVASAKPHMLDLNIGDGLLKGTIGLRGNTLINTSAVNTETQMDALTYADRANRVKFSHLSVYMVDQDLAADPDTTAALELSDISLHFERPHDAEHKAGSESIIEPAENAHSIITVTMKFPRMNAVNAAHFAKFIAETEKKAYVWFTGNLLPGDAVQHYELQFYFPRLRITSIDYPFDEIVPGTIVLQAEEAAANPDGFGFAIPYVRIVNKRSTDYLA